MTDTPQYDSLVDSMEISQANDREDPDAGLEGLDEGDLNSPQKHRIHLEKNDRSLAELKRWCDRGSLILNPDWQRNYVWNQHQASKLIESFLLGIPVPVVYLAKNEKGDYEVIDGQQRLRSVFNFLDSKYSLRGLDILTDIENKKFNALDRTHQQTIEDATLRSFEFESNTDRDMLFVVFERLNTGGTKLNEMEIRNCIFRGKLNNLIIKLAKSNEFKRVVNQDGIDKRMVDRALVLRFLAFYERTHTKCTKGLKRFLNDFFEIYQDATDDRIANFEKVFEHCMNASFAVFGKSGFRLKEEKVGSHSIGAWSNRANAPIFQAISTSFADYDIGQITRAGDQIYEEYLDLISTDTDWVERVRRATGESTRLKYVFEEWRKRLDGVLADVPPNDGRRVFSKALKKEIFSADKTCAICGQEVKTLDDAALDHEKHYWRGGATIPENARIAHRHCNQSRGGGD